MQVVLCQTDIVWEDKSANHAHARKLLHETDIPEQSLILLPEMFSTGFSMNVEKVAEGDSRETEYFLAHLAKQYNSFVCGGVVNQNPEGWGTNECVLFGPTGEEVGRYRKIHPFSFGKEAESYVGGDAVKVFDIAGMRYCPVICYDLRFPEAFRAGVDQGAQVFSVIACWPAVRETHWLKLLQARAIENQAYVVGVNRVGSDPKLEYSGKSVVIDPLGNIMLNAGSRPRAVTASLNLDWLGKYREKFPALNDRRLPVGRVVTGKTEQSLP